jgi:isocitrate/isopropylmalate dehydrogenase
VHKANVLVTCGLFCQAAFELAESYPEIHLKRCSDTWHGAGARPERSEIIVTMNLFGDI